MVFGDCDLEQAVTTAHNGLFWNDAEACASATRLFVEDTIYDQFVEKSVQMAADRKVGHPFNPDTQQGSQVRKNST